MLIAKITRKLLMNWYALTFTAILTLGLTATAGLTTARRRHSARLCGLPGMTRETSCTECQKLFAA